MSDFINTVDAVGDDALVDQIIQRTVTEFKDDVLTKVRDYGFYGCSALGVVNLPLVTTLGSNAFQNCTSLKEANLPLVTKISKDCFFGCTELVTVSLPQIKTIPANMFRECKKLTNLTVGEVTTIENYAFYSDGSMAVTSETLREVIKNVISVGSLSFYKCDNLTEMDFHKLASIDSGAFSHCTALKTLILRSETMCTLANVNAFTSTPIASGTGYIYVPSALVDTYKADSVWSTYADQIRAIEDYADELFLTQDGLVLNYDYRGHQDDTSTTIVDLASGVTASNFDQFGKNENGIYGKGTYKYLVLNVADEAGLAFIEAMKNGEGFTTETFGSYSGEDFFFGGKLTAYGSGGFDVAGGVFVKNGTSVPRILTDGSSAKTELEMETVIALDGEDVNLATNVSFAKIPNRSNFIHVVTTYSPNGTIRRWINGAPFKTPYQVENFKAWDYDTMFAASASHLPSMRNAYGYSASTDYMSCHRVYNRVLSEAEIKANMTASAAKIGLLL